MPRACRGHPRLDAPSFSPPAFSPPAFSPPAFSPPAFSPPPFPPRLREREGWGWMAGTSPAMTVEL
ncbi:MAG: hypothetical protein DCC74_04340 [Proteobacteria bacterium]|nr:MAG: hypothetical protein DCC74_04340 [Pseudomonadota bacterium]